MAGIAPGSNDKITVSGSYVRGEGTVKFDLLVAGRNS